MAERDGRGHLDRARRHAERRAEQVADTTSPKIDSAAKNARRAGRAAGEAARRTGEVTVDGAQSVVSSAREAVDGGVRTVTLQEFRDEVSSMLADITQVLVVLDARVRRLEAHLGLVEDASEADEEGP